MHVKRTVINIVSKTNPPKENEFPIQSVIPYVGPYLILLGVLRLYIFYRSFGINVIPFLEFSEILTSFLDVILVFIIAALLVTSFYIAFYKSSRKTRDIFKEKNLFKRLWMYVIHRYEIQAMAFFILAVKFSRNLHHPKYEVDYLSVLYTYLWVLVSTAILAEGIRWLSPNVLDAESDTKPTKIDNLFAKFLISLVSFNLFLTGLMTYRTINEIKENKRPYSVSIELDDRSTLFSNEGYYYVGKTNNFVFFYSELKRRTDVLPMNRVKSITFNESIEIKKLDHD